MTDNRSSEPPQQRLTKIEIEAIRLAFVKWQTPEKLYNQFDKIADKIGTLNFFNQSGLTVLRDAYVASIFALTQNSERVRLIEDRWPDFEIENDQATNKYEIVEAFEPNRLRGEEYRLNANRVVFDPVENWIARAEAAPIWIEVACKKKAAKNYSEKVGLVVYLSLCEFGIRQTEVESCFGKATEILKDKFSSVWVLWNESAYLLWSNGQSVSLTSFKLQKRRAF